ncbi:hypothetical protein FKG94_07240 [Exilibacterium tricleocarpae]|uniref:Uncharacterized protein n=2 Tax=Exilibacterium tricleocarpae TaxID=2591008 RepID=A0A545TZU4_9GAMM|nr:hypothetical protein FKG94_07240 [Exilibacterium tricleocarpae]
MAALIGAVAGCDNDTKPSDSFEVAAKGIHGAALSGDGRYAAIGSIHHGGSLWSTGDGERQFNWNHRPDETTTIISADFSPNGEFALTAAPHTLVLWSLRPPQAGGAQPGQPERFWTSPGEVLSIALTNRGRYALLGLADHSAVLFDVINGGIQRTLNHRSRVRSVDLSEDGRYALTGSEDYTAVFWDLQAGPDGTATEVLQRVQHQDDVQLVALSPDGKLALSAAKYDKAVLWDTRSGDTVGTIPLAAEGLRRGIRFTAARFSSDGRQLITGRPDQVVQLWSTASLRELARWKLPKRDAWKPTSAAVVAVSFSDGEGQYYAVSSNGFVHRLSK